MAPVGSRVPARIAVFASGGGSNLDAIFRHLDTLGATRGGDVVLVAADRGSAGALEKARARSVPAMHVPDAGDGAAIDALLRDHEVGLIVLAGYLRLVPPDVTRRFRGRMLNVHPAMLPAFGGAGMYGRRVHRAVLAAGSRITGATVHFVEEEYDRGPIITQWPVPVATDDTPETLAARVLVIEHALYPRVVDAVAAGRVALDASGRVRGPDPLVADLAFALVARDSDSIEASIDRMLGR
jgi:formyltetrahydrofolate-dependent phosphoribosylglycinamide formyltransferase